ncbi:hypothetical protein BN871_AV_00050 [Paenibacillus sp. P22]|nr:hypothetical protein BN871_AV_00050 [Paenibacillus sp. P22]
MKSRKSNQKPKNRPDKFLCPGRFMIRMTAPASANLKQLRLQLASHIIPYRLRQILAFQRHVDRRLYKSQLITDVMPASLEFKGMHRQHGIQLLQAVRQLDLAVLARLRSFEQAEYGRVEHVAPDDSPIGRRFAGSRLLHQVPDAGEHAFAFQIRDAVFVGLIPRNLHDRDDRRSGFPVEVHHLAQAWLRRAQNVVAQQHRKRLVADEAAGAEHRMAQAKRLPLADVDDVGQLGNAADDLQRLLVASCFQLVLQLDRFVEVVFDRALAAAADDHDALDAGCGGFFHDILNGRLVDERHHFLGLGFCCGQETGTEASCRDDCFADMSQVGSNSFVMIETWPDPADKMRYVNESFSSNSVASSLPILVERRQRTYERAAKGHHSGICIGAFRMITTENLSIGRQRRIIGMAETFRRHGKQARFLEGQAFVYCIHTTAGITIPATASFPSNPMSVIRKDLICPLLLLHLRPQLERIHPVRLSLE